MVNYESWPFLAALMLLMLRRTKLPRSLPEQAAAIRTKGLLLSRQ